MSAILADLETAAKEQTFCKVCIFLDTVEPPEDVQIDTLIRSQVNGQNRVSNDKVASILKAHGTSVGATTVRRHRLTCPPRTVQADTQA